ncbi:hypothetical protein JFQ72_004411 [Vibrio parahaemolyticus]|nr:hypothetical protein [Vibrio parahaemolyticus]
MEFDYSALKEDCIKEISDIYNEPESNVYRRAALCRAAYSRFKSRCAMEFIAHIVAVHDLDISFHSALQISRTLRGKGRSQGKGVSDDYLLEVFATPERTASHKVPREHVDLAVEIAKKHRKKFNAYVSQVVDEIKEHNFVATK